MEHGDNTARNTNTRNVSQQPTTRFRTNNNNNNNHTGRWIAPMGRSMTRSTTAPASAQVASIFLGGSSSSSSNTARSSSAVPPPPQQQLLLLPVVPPTPQTTTPTTTTTTSSTLTIPAVVIHQNSNHDSTSQTAINRTDRSSSNNHMNSDTSEPATTLYNNNNNHTVTTGEKAVVVTKQQQQHPSSMMPRAQFCQYDLLACINCVDNRREPTESIVSSTTAIHRKKMGPLLLDLRRLNFGSRTTTNNKHNDNDDAATPSLFSSTVVAQSRGNPSLGSSIHSTCLTTVPKNVVSSPIVMATGLSTGALCIHSFPPSSHDGDDDSMTYPSSLEYYQLPRNNRPATSVAWRPNHASHVAIGYANSSSSGSGGITATTPSSGLTTNSFGFPSSNNNNVSSPEPTFAPHRKSLLQPAGVNHGGGLSSNPSTVVDRQYGCFLWDVDHQVPSTIEEITTSSPPIRRTKTAPLYRLSHNQGVVCLSWILDEAGGQILAVGGQQRNVQLYDLRVAGSTSSTPAVQPSPISAFGHSSGIHGIESDPTRPWHFCTFSSTVGEVVKIWDVRSIDSPLSEIKPIGTKNSTSTITAAKWSTLCPGHLSILVGETTLSTYDTVSTVSRPIFSSTIRANKTVTSFAQYPFSNSHDESASIVTDHKKRTMMELFPRQIVAVSSDRTVNVVSCHRIAPVAVSPRSGQIVHTIGQSLLLGSAAEGPAAMEGSHLQLQDDISAIILRRAQGSADRKYSMDISSNIEILTEESGKGYGTSSVEQLLRLWKWIKIVEGFCLEDTPNWPAKSLIDAGVATLLASDKGIQDSQSYSESLGCLTFDSQGRRAALASCGWVGMYDLRHVMSDCESVGEYERSAALAVWHGNIEFAVDALERGAAFYASTGINKVSQSATYSETLEHIALSVAGYQVGDVKNTSTSVWRRSCTKLLQRPDLSDSKISGGTGYLRHILKFLMSISNNDGHKAVLMDTVLSLCDRVAFACRFLSQDDMMMFIDNCMKECQSTGNVEGLSITGLGRHGIIVLQSYVDITADIQTAALVTSRVVYPQDWPSERRTVDEWLYSYRTLLNTWQIWQIRAIFDVDRASVQRVAKLRLQQTGGSSNSRSRPIPAQLDARCNYCSAPLGLRRQENPPNQWLSKMKNVLPCCPRCRKPLPRCSICTLSLGVPNPYYELTKDRPRNSAPGTDDLSSLANLPFAEWFSWCLRCKHGGHAHHLVGWFAKHEVCPVSGCSCRCQFDGIREQPRPSPTAPLVTPNAPCIDGETN